VELLEKLCFEKKNYYAEIADWIAMKQQKLYVWGTGSVAVGVMNALYKNNIEVEGFFVNVENYQIDERLAMYEKPILSLCELRDLGEKISVVVGHSRYELVDQIKRENFIDKYWCLTGVTRSDIAISEEFVYDNIQVLQDSYDALADELSRENFVAYLNAKITNDISYVFSVFKENTTYFNNSLVCFKEREWYLDVGAYDGTSIEHFIEAYAGENYDVIAVEVLEEMCDKLIEKFRDNKRIRIVNTGLSDHCGQDSFNLDMQSTCLCAEGELREVTTIDQMLCEIASEKITTMKLCIGNSVVGILRGAERTIREELPRIIISVGIDTRALIDYIPLLDKLSRRNYDYYLRFISVSTEAILLYAIPRGTKGD